MYIQKGECVVYWPLKVPDLPCDKAQLWALLKVAEKGPSQRSTLESPFHPSAHRLSRLGPRSEPGSGTAGNVGRGVPGNVGKDEGCRWAERPGRCRRRRVARAHGFTEKQQVTEGKGFVRVTLCGRGGTGPGSLHFEFPPRVFFLPEHSLWAHSPPRFSFQLYLGIIDK